MPWIHLIEADDELSRKMQQLVRDHKKHVNFARYREPGVASAANLCSSYTAYLKGIRPIALTVEHFEEEEDDN